MAEAALAYDDQEPNEGALSEAAHDTDADAVVSLEKLAETGLNLAEHLDPATASSIVTICIEGYERDKSSREEWVKGFDKGMELVRLTRSEGRTLPFANAADVRFPLIATSCIQFNARAYPAIVNGPQIVKAEIEGDDPDGQKAEIGERVAEHMSWQLLVDMPEWETDTDKLLLHLPAAGMAFREYTWDSANKRPRSEFISAKRFVINQEATDLKTATLYTIEFERYAYQIVENQRSGVWKQTDLGFEDGERRRQEKLLRCYVRYDLDEDGYDEPYIAVIHTHSQTLLSLKADFWPEDIHRGDDGKIARVDRRVLIVPYAFIPDPEGKFYSLGFGQLLLNHNEIVDALLNQMLDATTLNNMGGGFVGQGVKLPGGEIERQPGAWKAINVPGQNLAQALVPYPQVPVSPVTFQLLNTIIESGRELTSTTAAITGNAPGNQPATTTLSNVEQSSQILTAINKRVFRSITEECNILHDLNGAYMPDEATFRSGDKQKPIGRGDYLHGDLGIKPVADPSMASAPQRMAQIQFLREYTNGNPRFNPAKVDERVMSLARIPGWKELLAPPQPPGPSPVEKMQLEAAATELADKHAKVVKLGADTMATHAKAAATLADAEATALENEITRRALAIDDAGAQAGAADAQHLQTFEALLDHPAPVAPGVGGMAGTPGDAPGAGGPPGAVQPPPGTMDGGDMGAGGSSPGGPGMPGPLGGLPGNIGPDPSTTDGA